MTGKSRKEPKLPVRLFATDHYPERRRLNIYSKPDIICFVESKLKDTDELRRIKASQFGHLFELPAIQCTTSCKLIQALMTRQLLTKRKYEMWSVFGGKPIRFSLIEFEALTGLHCGEFEEDYDHEANPSIPMGSGSTWKQYIGDDRKANLAHVADLFDSIPNMPGWRKFGLALILIIDGVLVANLQVHKPTPKYVEMLSDMESFMNFPWGRESFLKTIAALTPPRKPSGISEDGFAGFTKQMLQRTFTVKGFPQVLQLLAYKAIPKLLEKLPNSSYNRKLSEVSMVDLQNLTTLTTNEIRDIEFSENLVVQPMLPPKDGLKNGWNDEIKDKNVKYLVRLIKEDHSFTKDEWVGGDMSEPKFEYKPKETTSNQNRHIVGRTTSKISAKSSKLKPRKSGKKRSSRKQTRVDQFFDAEPLTLEQLNIKIDNHIAKTEFKFQKMADELKQSKALNAKYARLLKPNRRIPFGKLSSQKVLSSHRSRKRSAELFERTPESMEEDKVQSEEQNTPTVWERGSASTPMGNEQDEDNVESLVRKERSPKNQVDPETLDSVAVGYEPTPMEDDQHHVEDVFLDPLAVNLGSVGLGNEEEVLEDDQQSREDVSMMQLSPQNVDSVGVRDEPDSREEVQPPMVHDEPDRSEKVQTPMVRDEPDPSQEVQTPTLAPQEQDDNLVVDEPETRENVQNPQLAPQDLDDGIVGDEPETREDVQNPQATEQTEDCSGSLVRKRKRSKKEKKKHPPQKLDYVGVQNQQPPRDHVHTPQLPVNTCRAIVLRENDEEDIQTKNIVDSIDKLNSEEQPPVLGFVRFADSQPFRSGVNFHSPIIDVTDSSPPEKRQMPETSSYDISLCNVIKNNRAKRPRQPSELLPALDEEAYQFLAEYMKYCPLRIHSPPNFPDFQNKFLLQLATPKFWIISTHMEALMDMLARLHHQVLYKERSRFVSPWLINLIYDKKQNFKQAKDKNRVKWSDNIGAFVKNEYGEWLEDVDTLYVPMSLQNKHWVGLVINLELSSIEVLDPNCDVVKDTRLRTLLDHLAASLPYVIKKFCSTKNVVNRGVTPFSVQRTTGLYHDPSGGDCGPITVKFMEMHVYGSTHAAMSELNDTMVETMRKQYVLDLYADMLLPLYS